MVHNLIAVIKFYHDVDIDHYRKNEEKFDEIIEKLFILLNALAEIDQVHTFNFK
jgi:hypothetical protein